MDQYITPERIANAVGLDRTFSGAYLFVEGSKDVKLFSKFLDDGNCRIIPTFGKYKMRSVFDILTTRSVANKIGIRDADFLRVNNNPKYDISYNGDIYPTDCHDVEGMIINGEAFDDFIKTMASSEKISSFEKSHGNIRDLLHNLCYRIGALRLANKRYNLGLSFKPEKLDGNYLKYKKFIDEKKVSYLGDDVLINTVVEYSTNRGGEIKPRKFIAEKMNEICQEEHPTVELINGHDIAHILLIILKKGLNCSSRTLQDHHCVEELLYLSYSLPNFLSTELSKKISKWQSDNKYFILRPL